MKKMHVAGAVVAVIGFLAGAPGARAGLVFNAVGTFDDGVTLSGTVTIDTTTGTVESADVVLSSDSTHFNHVSSSGRFFNLDAWQIILAQNATDSTPNIELFLPGSTLVGYTGGDLRSTTFGGSPFTNYFYSVSHYSRLRSGTLTAAVPEPSTLTATGISLAACLLFAGGRRWLRAGNSEAVTRRMLVS